MASASDESRQTLRASGDPPDGPLREAANEQTQDLTGAVLLDRFKLVRLVGRGGMGAVYEARDLLLDATVALKLLQTSTGPLTNLEQLRREVLIARRVTHPHVARLFDCFEAEQGLFLTMEYLDGETLGERRAREPPMAREESLATLRQTCSGVDAIHAQGIVHRDLKPSNIFLTRSAAGIRVAVTDFGIAHAEARPGILEHLPKTGTNVVVGTPHYMAPEQVRGNRVTTRADIFALGVIAAELFAGTAPVDGRWGASSSVRLRTTRSCGPGRPESCSPRSSVPS